MARSLVRRDFLRIAAISGAAVPAVVVGTAGPAAGAAGRGMVGRVESATSQRLTLPTAQGSVDVVADAGARLYSGAFGEVRDTRAFLRGYRVAVEGQPYGDGAVRAKSVGSVFTQLEARVTSVSADGSVAESTLGPIALTAGRLPFTPPSLERRLRGGRVTPGTVISGLGWVHPGTGERYLMVRGS